MTRRHRERTREELLSKGIYCFNKLFHSVLVYSTGSDLTSYALRRSTVPWGGSPVSIFRE
jgi:hypothetical protein